MAKHVGLLLGFIGIGLTLTQVKAYPQHENLVRIGNEYARDGRRDHDQFFQLVPLRRVPRSAPAMVVPPPMSMGHGEDVEESRPVMVVPRSVMGHRDRAIPPPHQSQQRQHQMRPLPQFYQQPQQQLQQQPSQPQMYRALPSSSDLYTEPSSYEPVAAATGNNNNGYDYVDYGAYTGGHGAFGWYSDHPVYVMQGYN